MDERAMRTSAKAVVIRAPLYPSRYRRAIMNVFEGKPQSVYLGNEEMGDPEITE